jgi:N-acetylglucosamine malate deacetylase 1
MRSVLAVAAHPDDEVLLAGATLARHAAAGDEVHLLILGEGAASRSRTRTRGVGRDISRLGTSARKAARILGARAVELEALPDNRFDSVSLLEIVRLVEARVAALAPSIVYTHHPGDLNIDHRLAAEAVLTACRPLPGSPVEEVLAGEVLSSTGWRGSDSAFRPSLWVDVSGSMPAKLEALRAYATELRPFPHARSLEAVEALARFRGAEAGFAAAEAFEVLRIRRPSAPP